MLATDFIVCEFRQGAASPFLNFGSDLVLLLFRQVAAIAHNLFSVLLSYFPDCFGKLLPSNVFCDQCLVCAQFGT